MKILLIDDNQSMTKLFSRFFKTKGWDCTVSDDGVGGLRQIDTQHFDAVLLDLAMPEFSGFDVIKALKKNGKIKEERIFVLTASAISPSEIEKLINQGIKSCIKKPVRLGNLLKILAA